MDKITIKQNKNGYFTVKQGDRYASMSFEEMLGLISALTMPEKRPCIHWIKTKEQHDAEKDFLKRIPFIDRAEAATKKATE